MTTRILEPSLQGLYEKADRPKGSHFSYRARPVAKDRMGAAILPNLPPSGRARKTKERKLILKKKQLILNRKPTKMREDRGESSKKRVTTLEGMSDHEITCLRRDGNTTRLVDNAIQIIFRGDVCVVMDHFEMGRNRDMNDYLMKKILNRLQNEHKLGLRDERLKFDRVSLEISLRD